MVDISVWWIMSAVVYLIGSSESTNQAKGDIFVSAEYTCAVLELWADAFYGSDSSVTKYE